MASIELVPGLGNGGDGAAPTSGFDGLEASKIGGFGGQKSGKKWILYR